MTDSIKGIFKVLIKVPVIIAVSYLILNLFTFTVSYFRLLGASYSVMQIAMENNFIPTDEMTSINKYLEDSVATTNLKNVKVIAGDVSNPNKKRQYGSTVIAGVQGDFYWITPFMKPVSGYKNGTSGANFSSIGIKFGGKNKRTITIQYKVPGLKYYPDLES